MKKLFVYLVLAGVVFLVAFFRENLFNLYRRVLEFIFWLVGPQLFLMIVMAGFAVMVAVAMKNFVTRRVSPMAMAIKKGEVGKVVVTFTSFEGEDSITLPVWEMSSQEISEIARYLTNLTPFIGKPPDDVIVIKEGFDILNPSRMDGLPSQISIFKDIITVRENQTKPPSYYENNGELEDWLLKQARERGHTYEADEIEEDLKLERRSRLEFKRIMGNRGVKS